MGPRPCGFCQLRVPGGAQENNYAESGIQMIIRSRLQDRHTRAIGDAANVTSKQHVQPTTHSNVATIAPGRPFRILSSSRAAPRDKSRQRQHGQKHSRRGEKDNSTIPAKMLCLPTSWGQSIAAAACQERRGWRPPARSIVTNSNIQAAHLAVQKTEFLGVS